MVCLFLLVVISLMVVWLCTVGLPQFILRYIEGVAAQQGIYMKVGAVRLAPTFGLAAHVDQIEFFYDAARHQHLAKASSTTAGVSVAGLLSGKIDPIFFRVREADIVTPACTSMGKKVGIHVRSIEAVRGPDGFVQITNGQLSVQGITVKLSGSLDPELLRSKVSSLAIDARNKTEKIKPLPETLQQSDSKYQGILDTIFQKIEMQHWQGEDAPELEIRADVHQDIRISVRGTIPRFDLDSHFHFRRSSADILYSKNVLTINSLHIETVNPDSPEKPEASIDLQGAYDLDERRLSISMKSTAALLAMVQPLCNEQAKGYLSKFSHKKEESPHIDLMGDITFGEDFAPRNARVRGSLYQRSLLVRQTKINDLKISFYYDNGNFSIDKLDMQVGSGHVHASASAKDRLGRAELQVDMPVQSILTLVNELAPGVKVELPEGLVLGENIILSLNAKLDAPLFSPQQSVWQDFVPSVHYLRVSLQSQVLSYAGVLLDNPQLKLTLSGVRQDEKLRPRSMQEVIVSLKADKTKLLAQSGHPPLHAEDVNLDFTINNLNFNTHSIPDKAERVTVKAGAAYAAQAVPPPDAETPQPTSTASNTDHPLYEILNPRMTLQAENVAMPSFRSPESLHVASASLHIDSAAARLRDVRMNGMHIYLDDVLDIVPLGDMRKLFSAADLDSSLDAVEFRSTQIGKVKLTAELKEYTDGRISVTIGDNETATPLISAHPDWSNPQQIVLNELKLHLPKEVSEMVLNIANTELEDIEIPECVDVYGILRIKPSLQVQDFALHVNIPQLVRTPHRLPVFRGQRVPVGLYAYVDAARIPDCNDFNFNAQLSVEHATGQFYGHVSGNSSGVIFVNDSTCTIRPDVIDKLLDNSRAHSIIRDFRFDSSSGSLISDIRVAIDLTNGERVDSFCKVNLTDTQYQLNGIEDVGDGRERVRRDLGGAPFTRVHRASCDVKAHVCIDCRAADGSPIPDETVVTITDAKLVYDNTPWLRRNKQSSGTKKTELTGKSITIDVEKSFLELKEVAGDVYPAYSLGMFYPDIFDFLKDVKLPHPVKIKTERCLFPIYDDCKLPMSGVISVFSKKGAGFRFIGTTIPLDNFSGFIFLADDYVLLDRMNAKSWDGVLDAVVRIGFAGKQTSLDGFVKADCMDMKKIAASYGSEQSRALCSGNIRFRAPRADVNSLSAYGSADIIGGDLMKLNIFRPVAEMITDLPNHVMRLEKSAKEEQGMPQEPGFFTRAFSWIFRNLGSAVGSTSSSAAYIPGVNHLIAYDLKEAHANFRIENGHLFTDRMKAIGSNLNVRVNADIDLNSLTVRGNLWPKISSIPTIVLAPLTILSDFMIDIVLYGSLSDVKWRIAMDRRIKKPQQK